MSCPEKPITRSQDIPKDAKRVPETPQSAHESHTLFPKCIHEPPKTSHKPPNCHQNVTQKPPNVTKNPRPKASPRASKCPPRHSHAPKNPQQPKWSEEIEKCPQKPFAAPKQKHIPSIHSFPHPNTRTSVCPNASEASLKRSEASLTSPQTV